MTAAELSLDLVLSTVPDFHDNYPYILALQRDGTLVVVGTLAPFAKPTDNSKVAIHRWSVARSLISGVAETQEVSISAPSTAPRTRYQLIAYKWSGGTGQCRSF